MAPIQCRVLPIYVLYLCKTGLNPAAKHLLIGVDGQTDKPEYFCPPLRLGGGLMALDAIVDVMVGEGWCEFVKKDVVSYEYIQHSKAKLKF